jgi:glycopeptide antibiotics resistance protein
LRVAARMSVPLAIALILAFTLVPADPAGPLDWQQMFCFFCSRASLADAASNIALFIPLGLALPAWFRRSRSAVAFAATLSLSIELAQFAVPGRDPSLSDVVFNIVGAAVGLYLARMVPRLACPRPRVAARLSLVAAIAAAAVFVLTDMLLRPALPDAVYFGGSAELHTSGQPLRIGGNTDPSGSFQGRIDDVRIYRRALTEAEIRSDMRQPATASASSPDLVAAYAFDEGAGSILTDVSGHGHAGRVQGAAWTAGGRSGGALSFNGAGDVVLIAPAPALELTRSMTLQAWIYPTAAGRGWRAVLQKEFDDYFLLSSSWAGALRPAGGGTFGASTERLTAPSVIPIGAWTHVAFTYDGAMSHLYVNGDPVARRLRWYPGRLRSAVLDGLTIPAGGITESKALRARLLAGAPLVIRVAAAEPTTTLAPLVAVNDASRSEILLVAAQGHDVVVRLRSRAAALELDSPAVRAAGVLRGIAAGDEVTLTVRRTNGKYCVDVDQRATCGLGVPFGMGWSFLAYSQVPPGWPHAALSTLWLGALLFPCGFWFRPRWEAALGPLVLGAGVAVSCGLGTLTASVPGVAAGVLGLTAGWACARAVGRDPHE